MRRLILDIESQSVLDLKKTGTYVYSASEDTVILCVAYTVDDEPIKLWRPGDPCPKEIKQAIKESWEICAHNAQFERLMWRHILGPRHGWPEPALEQWRCTMAMALAQALPGKLETVGKILSLQNQKDVVGNRVMLQMAKPRKARKGEDPGIIYWVEDAEKMTSLEQYCVQDVETERELLWTLFQLSEVEQQVWEINERINDRGLRIDRELAEAAQRIAEAADVYIDEEIAKVTDGEVTSINQVKKLTEWLGVVNLNKKTIAEILEDPEKYAKETAEFKWTPKARQALELRAMGAQAAVKKVKSMLTRCSDDDRIRGAFVYHVAGTGRFSSRGVQLQNLKRLTIKDEELEKAIAVIGAGDFEKAREVYPNPLAVIGDLIRAMICAAPGHTLVGADYSGIEARVTAWLAGETSKLEVFAKFDACTDEAQKKLLDPYVVAATKIYGKPAEQITKEDRQIGKGAELGLGFGGGINALRKFMPNPDAFTDNELYKIRDAWRAAHPNICTLWDGLERAAWKATSKPGTTWQCGEYVTFEHDGVFLWMTLPSGRRISYPYARKARLVNKHGAWVPSYAAELELFFKDSAAGAWRDVRLYGGYLCENLTQGVARDLLTEAMMRIEAAGFNIVATVHDEAIIEVPNADVEKVTKKFAELMVEIPDWGCGIPVVAKPWASPRYTK